MKFRHYRSFLVNLGSLAGAKGFTGGTPGFPSYALIQRNKAAILLRNGSFVINTRTTSGNQKLDFSDSTNSQYVPLIFSNWM